MVQWWLPLLALQLTVFQMSTVVKMHLKLDNINGLLTHNFPGVLKAMY